MKNLTLILLLTIGVLSPGAIVATSTTPVAAKPPVTTGWKKFTQSAYSLAYPANWEVKKLTDTIPEENIAYAFAALAPSGSAPGEFRANINLVIESFDDINSKMTVDEYAKAGMPQLETAMQNYQLVENKKLTKAGREYYRTIFTWKMNDVDLQVEQNYWVKNGKAYVLTFTTTRDRFAKDRQIGSQILKSFALK